MNINNPKTRELLNSITSQINPNEVELRNEIYAEIHKPKPNLTQFKDSLNRLGAISRVSLALKMVDLEIIHVELKKEPHSPEEDEVEDEVEADSKSRNAYRDDSYYDYKAEQWKHDLNEPQWRLNVKIWQSEDLSHSNLSSVITHTLEALKSGERKQDALKEITSVSTDTTAPKRLQPYLDSGKLVIIQARSSFKGNRVADVGTIADIMDDLVVGETLSAAQEYCDKISPEKINPFHIIFGQLCADYRKTYGSDYIIPRVNELIQATKEKSVKTGNPNQDDNDYYRTRQALRGAGELGFDFGK